MKYSFVNQTLENMNSVLGTVQTKDTVTEITIGAKDLGDKLKVVTCVTAPGEQITYDLPCKKPEGWDGSPVTIGVKSQTFSAVISSLLKFKEDVYLDIAEGSVKAGVAGKAEVSLDTVAELPQKIEGGKTMLQFVLKGSDLQNFIRKGLLTGSNEARDDGTGNAVMTIDASGGENAGSITGFSTNRNAGTIGRGKALMPKAPEGNEAAARQLEEMKAVLDEYCTSTKQNAAELTIVMPISSVRHLQSLATELPQVLFSVTERYVSAALGNVGTYTFRQGAKAPAAVAQIEAMLDKMMEGAVQVGFDAAQISNAVSFINDMDKLDGTLGKKAVHLKVSADGLMMISGNGDRAETKVKVLNGSGEADMLLNGQLLRDALAALDKGNIVLSFGSRMLAIQNGTTTEGISDNALAFIAAVMENKSQAEETDEAEAEE